MGKLARPLVFLAPRHDYEGGGGWSRRVSYAGTEYIVGIERGKRVRIMYKPRGPGAWGFWWHGFVRDVSGRTLWSALVGKSTGVLGIVREAFEPDPNRPIRVAPIRIT